MTVFDREALMQRLDFDEQLCRDLVKIYQDTLSEKLAQVEQAFGQKDNLLLGELAHSLKGSSANIGASLVQDAAWQLEQSAKDSNEQQMAQKINLLKQEVDKFNQEVQAFLNSG